MNEQHCDEKTRKSFQEIMEKMKNGGKNLTTGEERRLVNGVMIYIEVALDFFFSALLPMIHGLKSYLGMSCDDADVSAFLYCEFREDGTWPRLAQFRYEMSLMGWMDRCSKQIIGNKGRREGLITHNPKLTAKNTNLTVRSIDSEEERKLIVDQVGNRLYRRMLSLIYVYKKDEALVQKELGMDDQTFKSTLKKAEFNLRSVLLEEKYLFSVRNIPGKGKEKVNLVELAISEKFVPVAAVEYGEVFETAATSAIYFPDSMSDAFLEDRYPGMTAEAQRLRFTKDIIKEMNFTTTMEKRIFIERYINDTPAEAVASELGCRSEYVHMDFSRTREKYKKYVEKRNACGQKAWKAVANIIHFSTNECAMKMPFTNKAMDEACKQLNANELSMCRKIAQAFTSQELEDEEVFSLLSDFHIVNYLTTKELRIYDKKFAPQKDPVTGRIRCKTPKRADHYLLSSSFVARNLEKDVETIIYNVSGSARYEWKNGNHGRLTAAIGLSFMTECILKFGNT